VKLRISFRLAREAGSAYPTLFTLKPNADGFRRAFGLGFENRRRQHRVEMQRRVAGIAEAVLRAAGTISDWPAVR